MTKKEVTHLSYQVTGCAIKVHKALGPGLLESIYEKCLIYELKKNEFYIEQQLPVTVFFDDIEFDSSLKVDILVEDTIVVEIKAIENILPVHQAQLLTYMKILRVPQGLLVNFNAANISKTIQPYVNEYFTALDDF